MQIIWVLGRLNQASRKLVSNQTQPRLHTWNRSFLNPDMPEPQPSFGNRVCKPTIVHIQQLAYSNSFLSRCLDPFVFLSGLWFLQSTCWVTGRSRDVILATVQFRFRNFAKYKKSLTWPLHPQAPDILVQLQKPFS